MGVLRPPLSLTGCVWLPLELPLSFAHSRVMNHLKWQMSKERCQLFSLSVAVPFFLDIARRGGAMRLLF